MTVLQAVVCDVEQDGRGCLGVLLYAGGPSDVRDVARAWGWEIPADRPASVLDELREARGEGTGPRVTRCPACVSGYGPITGHRCAYCGAVDAGTLLCTRCGAQQPETFAEE